ncbi:MAG: hypothetical protein JJU36_04825 [Phycisphaeraceae bacterium]|nr:hypothetical protein [Phycisphaeraceae bacterium]
MADVIILGPHARAAAACCRRAGLQPWCAQPSPPSDLRELATIGRIEPDANADQWLALLHRQAPPGPVLLMAPLWSDLELVEAIARERPLLGTRQAGLSAALAPAALAEIPRLKGIRPLTMKPRPRLWMRLWRKLAGASDAESGRWMTAGINPEAPAGGGTEPISSPWRGGRSLETGHWLVRRVEGTHLTACFVGDGWSSVLQGVCERITMGLHWSPKMADPPPHRDTSARKAQAADRPALEDQHGPSPRALPGPSSSLPAVSESDEAEDWRPQDAVHACSGMIGPIKLPKRREPMLSKLGVSLAQKFDLRGLFALEMILDRRGHLRPLAIWPAFSPAHEVLELAGMPPAMAHPTLRLIEQPSRRPASTAAEIAGVAWITTPRRIVAPPLDNFVGVDAVSDIPQPGTPLDSGQRICSVQVTADGPESCRTMLGRLAGHVFRIVMDRAEHQQS